MKTFNQLSLDERLSYLYLFLTSVKKNRKLTSGRLKESFSKRMNLSRYSVDRIADILWFSGFITTVYKGYPPRPYYAVTSDGEEIILKGKFEVIDFPAEPSWIRASLLRGVKLVPRFVRVGVKNFVFEVEPDWDYKLRVFTPKEWIEKWESKRFGKAYSVKHRSVVFLQTLGLAVNYFTGYKFVKLTEEEKKRRIKNNRILKVWRTLVFDPENKVKVIKVGTKKGVTEWVVDFSNFKKDLPETIDINGLYAVALSKGYRAMLS